MGNQLSNCAGKPKKKRKFNVSSCHEYQDEVDSRRPVFFRGFDHYVEKQQYFTQTYPHEPFNYVPYNVAAEPPILRTNRRQMYCNNSQMSDRSHGNLHVSRREVEPPRLIMWGMYKPKYPGKNWVRRVQRERLKAMRYGRAMWSEDSNFPQYLRHYVQNDVRCSTKPELYKEAEMQQLLPIQEELVAEEKSKNLSRMPHTNGYYNQGFCSVPPAPVSNSLNPSAFHDDHVFSSTNPSELDSGMKSSCSDPSRHKSLSMAFEGPLSGSRIPEEEGLTLRARHPNKTDQATQCEDNSIRVIEQLENVTAGHFRDSHTKLEETLDILQTAVSELNNLAATLIANSTVLSNPQEESGINDANPEIIVPEKSKVVSTIPNESANVFEEFKENDTSDLKTDEHLSNEETADTVSVIEPLCQPVTEQSVSSLNVDEITAAKPPKSVTSSSIATGRTSQSSDNTNVHYRLKIADSPANLNLFKFSTISSTSNSKTLLQIAKDTYCQFYVLPNKEYSGGRPKRTVLIRAPNKRCIKSCLREMSEHYPSLVRMR